MVGGVVRRLTGRGGERDPVTGVWMYQGIDLLPLPEPEPEDGGEPVHVPF